MLFQPFAEIACCAYVELTVVQAREEVQVVHNAKVVGGDHLM